MAPIEIEQLKLQSIINVSLLVRLVEGYGLSPLPMLERAGISPALLQDPKAKITFQQDITFVRAMLESIDDPEIGLEAGKLYKLSAYGHLGMAIAACDRVEDAIQLSLRYIRLAYSHFEVSFLRAEGKAILRFKDETELAQERRFYLVRDFYFILISMRDIFPRSLASHKFKEISFDFACPSSQASYEQAFGCSVNFSMPVNEIKFDEDYLSSPLPQANRLVRQLLEDECETQKNEVTAPEGLAEKIRLIIRESEYSIPNLEVISKQFNATSRTVRRKLSAEGYSFQGLLMKELSHKAIHYLETTTLTVEQIALLLGYSETASFVHAFRRWTGKAPKAYRS